MSVVTIAVGNTDLHRHTDTDTDTDVYSAPPLHRLWQPRHTGSMHSNTIKIQAKATPAGGGRCYTVTYAALLVVSHSGLRRHDSVLKGTTLASVALPLATRNRNSVIAKRSDHGHSDRIFTATQR